MQKKILGIAGSPRKAATYESLQVALEGAQTLCADELNVELVSFKGKNSPCNHCNACKRNGGRCVVDDDMTPLYESLVEADSFIFASPVYAMNMTPQLSAFLAVCGHCMIETEASSETSLLPPLPWEADATAGRSLRSAISFMPA